MLSDRNYMRDESANAALKPLAWVIGGLWAAYILQHIVQYSAPDALLNWIILTPETLQKARLWTLFTHVLVHDSVTPTADGPLGILHLGGNSLMIFFFGRPILELIGTRRFLGSILAMLFAGAVLWSAVHFTRAGVLYGSTAIATGLLALYCLLWANQRVTFLLFFVLPVTVVPKYLGLITAGIITIFFLFAELFGSWSGINHSAHLGGMIAGLIIYRWVRNLDENDEPAEQAVELPRWLKKRKSATESAEKFKLNLPPNRADLKAEVDRILDKINTTGFGSLTPEEKRTLDEARELLSKR